MCLVSTLLWRHMGRVEVNHYAFVISILDGCDWWGPCLHDFMPGARDPYVSWIGGWMGSRGTWDAVKRRNSLHVLGVHPHFSGYAAPSLFIVLTEVTEFMVVLLRHPSLLAGWLLLLWHVYLWATDTAPAIWRPWVSERMHTWGWTSSTHIQGKCFWWMNRLACCEENITVEAMATCIAKIFDQQEEGNCVNYWNLFYKSVTSAEVVFLSFILTWWHVVVPDGLYHLLFPSSCVLCVLHCKDASTMYCTLRHFPFLNGFI